MMAEVVTMSGSNHVSTFGDRCSRSMILLGAEQDLARLIAGWSRRFRGRGERREERGRGVASDPNNVSSSVCTVPVVLTFWSIRWFSSVVTRPLVVREQRADAEPDSMVPCKLDSA